MNFESFRRVLQRTPVNVTGNRESILFLDYDFTLVEGEALIRSIDSVGSHIGATPIVIYPPTKKTKARFPCASIKESFCSLDINRHFFNRFEVAKKLFVTQSSIKDSIINSAGKYDFVALIVIDGLSYHDCAHWSHVRPCLVDTLTETTSGFTNIICGHKRLPYELFKLHQFDKRIGFSFWEKDQCNELTDEIFKGFESVNKYESYDAVLNQLQGSILRKTYIQIVMQGLDGVAHNNRDVPLVAAIVEDIYNKVHKTAALLKDTGLKGAIYVTSDHGILWKHKANLKVIGSHSATNHFHMRHYDTKISSKDCMVFNVNGMHRSALRFPYILRNLRPNEWGVHGGISVEESIVPLLIIEVNER